MCRPCAAWEDRPNKVSPALLVAGGELAAGDEPEAPAAPATAAGVVEVPPGLELAAGVGTAASTAAAAGAGAGAVGLLMTLPPAWPMSH